MGIIVEQLHEHRAVGWSANPVGEASSNLGGIICHPIEIGLTDLPKTGAPLPFQGLRACEHRCGGGSSLFWAEMITHKLASIQCVHNVIILQQNVLIKSLCLGKV